MHDCPLKCRAVMTAEAQLSANGEQLILILFRVWIVAGKTQAGSHDCMLVHH